jgi:DNA-binding NtrC family response regulator
MAMTPGRVLHPRPLPHDLHGRSKGAPGDSGRPLLEQIEELERLQIEKALTRTRGNQTRAARELGLTEHSLRYRIRKYGLPDFRRFRQIPRKPRHSD